MLRPLIAFGLLALILADRTLSGVGPRIRFQNVASAAGIPFVLENSATPEKQIIETMPGGVAAFDFDDDGRVDLFFTNGAAVSSLKKSESRFKNRLYRNLGNMRFQDVTDQAGLAGSGYSMGAAAGDFDNDGHPDLFVAGVRSNRLYRNLGNGRFEDVTARSAIRSDLWSVAAGWFDYDKDGLLDLFVVNYLDWSPDKVLFCGDPNGARAYCHPNFYKGLANRLYRNLGNGMFEDVSERAGIAQHVGKGMSVAFADYDGDGWPDAFVTNDKTPNFLFRNTGHGTFEEVALDAGVALPEQGRDISSMGADFRDYDNDGWPDLAIAALAGETFPLFRNVGKGFFRDATYSSNLAALTNRRSGWSPVLADLNNDGWKDLFVTGSHVNDTVEAFEATPYRLPNAVFVNTGSGSFEDASAYSGPAFQVAGVHRGSAIADFNNDGKLDAAVSLIGERAELWENTTSTNNGWIEIRLEGGRSNRDGIGAHVQVDSHAVGGKQWNDKTSAAGYASSSDVPVHFGTGNASRVDVKIQWPSGIMQTLLGVHTNQLITVHEATH